MSPEKEERYVSVLDDVSTDTVGQTRELLQTVRVESPVPGVVDHLLHVQDGQAQLLAVGAGRTELQNSKPGQSVNNINHVENHGAQNFNI